MPDIIITDKHLGVLILFLAMVGVTVTTTLLIDLCKWVVTRRKRRKYQITIVTHCDELIYKTNSDKDTTQ